MGQLSPENDGGEWLNGATGPRVGATFKGVNSRAGDKWSTMAKVKIFEPPHRFTFDVSWHRIPIARWEYSIDIAPRGMSSNGDVDGPTTCVTPETRKR